jgi:hypothetical protein
LNSHLQASGDGLPLWQGSLKSSLLDDGRTVSFSNRQRFPTTTLFNAILAYNTFRTLVTSLCTERAQNVVQFYRTRFAGFLEDADFSSSDDHILADFLAAEGVLLRPVAEEPKCCVASPLIDALVTLQVIPNQFPIAPSIPVPIILDIPFVLTEALKCFDKDLTQLAYLFLIQNIERSCQWFTPHPSPLRKHLRHRVEVDPL